MLLQITVVEDLPYVGGLDGLTFQTVLAVMVLKPLQK
jgi:hypothetical protein